MMSSEIILNCFSTTLAANLWFMLYIIAMIQFINNKILAANSNQAFNILYSMSNMSLSTQLLISDLQGVWACIGSRRSLQCYVWGSSHYESEFPFNDGYFFKLYILYRQIILEHYTAFQLNSKPIACILNFSNPQHQHSLVGNYRTLKLHDGLLLTITIQLQPNAAVTSPSAQYIINNKKNIG